ncbi:MAG: heme biosynthesis HemY N-terminal domain-containing protein [Acidocella sp.]|nr:heme biosynthesis HemY N-terminal domain-containing protein [Acidocella sp.]
MLRALRTIIMALIVLGIAWWVSSFPGTVTAHSGNYTITATTPVAILGLAVSAMLLTIIFRVIGSIRRAPGNVSSWQGSRRKNLGEIAINRGLTALAAGDAKGAEAEASRARKLLGDTPLVLLLTAEAARLNGKHDQADAAFKKLATHKDMAFLGHRGLGHHAASTGNHDAARIHALAAEDAYPGSQWARAERLAAALKQQDWRTALGLTQAPAEVAAIATAAANATQDRGSALRFAKQAVKADPSLVPATVAYARSLMLANKARAAKKALLKGWTALPHPMIAAAYLENIPDPIERVQAASQLAAAKPGHPESEILLAETSLAAKLTGEARRHAQSAIAAGLTDKRPYAVLTALGDSLGDAPVDAPAPKWTCLSCHTEHVGWHATCPSCGKAGTLVWKSAQTALVPA